MTRCSSYYHKEEAPSTEPSKELGIEIEADFSFDNCPFIQDVSPGYSRCYIELNASDELLCLLDHFYGVVLGTMKGQAADYLKTLMDNYPYPALYLEGLIMEYDINTPVFRVHVRVWINYGDQVTYDDYLSMVGFMFVEARSERNNYLRVCSYSPDSSSNYDW